jgi:UDP-N-acetyl-D-mannosaminouronate:lipid I N-acetyl-D-mannosaminouronosyltransferase
MIKTMQDNRVELNGVKVHPFTSREELLDYVSEKKGILVAINAEKILHATPQTRSIINRNIGYCDGYGAVMALKKRGYQNVVKIPGCELWLSIIHATYQQGKTYYLVGGKQEIIDQTVEKLKVDYPGINIVNYRNGYIKTEEEKQCLIDDIAEKKPDVVFVAMGSPKQELLMEEMSAAKPATVPV